jgi:hypothetical protein
MKLQHITMIALLSAAVAAPVLAQQGMGPGSGMGQGMGPGGGGHFAFNQDNTPGWSLMSAEERVAHRDQMLAAKTYEECKAAQMEHHNAMEARAKEKGAKLRGPGQNACDRMKARGLFK